MIYYNYNTTQDLDIVTIISKCPTLVSFCQEGRKITKKLLHLIWGTKKWLWLKVNHQNWMAYPPKNQHRYGQTTMKVDHVHWKPTSFRYRLVKLLEFRSLFLMVKSPLCIDIYIYPVFRTTFSIRRQSSSNIPFYPNEPSPAG